ncbi:MAG: hypothetical protein IT556_19340, partial [Acetobacteraceae bacterium]|nr:hypothetical protein [Acetobacteraceae bacterium]
TTPLASLTTDAGGTTSIAGATTTTTGSQTYGDAVTLPGAATFASSGSSVAFTSTLNPGGTLTFNGASNVDIAQGTGNLTVLLPTSATVQIAATGNLSITGGANQNIGLGNTSAGGTLNVLAAGTGGITQVSGTTVQSGGNLQFRAPNGDITFGNVTSGTQIAMNNTGPSPTLTGEGKTLRQIVGTQLQAPAVRLMAGFNGAGANNFTMGTNTEPVRFGNSVTEVHYAAPSTSLLWFAGQQSLKDNSKIFIITPPGGPESFDFNGSSARGSQATNVAGEVVGGVTSEITREVQAGFRPGRIDRVIDFGFQGNLSVPPSVVINSIRGVRTPEATPTSTEDEQRRKR